MNFNEWLNKRNENAYNASGIPFYAHRDFSQRPTYQTQEIDEPSAERRQQIRDFNLTRETDRKEIFNSLGIKSPLELIGKRVKITGNISFGNAEIVCTVRATRQDKIFYFLDELTKKGEQKKGFLPWHWIKNIEWDTHV